MVTVIGYIETVQNESQPTINGTQAVVTCPEPAPGLGPPECFPGPGSGAACSVGGRDQQWLSELSHTAEVCELKSRGFALSPLSGDFKTPCWWVLQCLWWKGPLLVKPRLSLCLVESEGAVLRGCCVSCLCFCRPLWLLFKWIFITSGLVSDTQSRVHSHVCTSSSSLDTHQWPSCVGQEASVPKV